MVKRAFKGSTMLNPNPAVLITSKSITGHVNVFTAAWIGMVCTRPPMLTVGIRPERLSYEYIKKSMEFVVNLPTKQMTKIVDYCGVVSGKTCDKIKNMNITVEDCKTVSAPMICECPVSIECKVKSITKLGSHDMFLAEITSINVDEKLIDNSGKIHFEKADLISYSHGDYYSLNQKSLGKFGFSIKKHKKQVKNC